MRYRRTVLNFNFMVLYDTFYVFFHVVDSLSLLVFKPFLSVQSGDYGITMDFLCFFVIISWQTYCKIWTFITTYKALTNWKFH